MPNEKPNYKRTAGFWVAVFLLGGVAGVLGDKLLVPQLASIAPFNKISWIANIKNGTTIINKTEKITVSEDSAYQNAISQLSNSVVGIRAERTYRVINQKQVPLVKPEILAQGTGFILTSDGEIITANALVPPAATRVVVIKNGQESEAQILKRDEINGLALLKIDNSNLPVMTLGDWTGLKLGEKIFLLGAGHATTTLALFTDLGFIKTISPDLTVNFAESQLANGSPLANIKGEVIGLNLVDVSGQIKVVTEDKIRALLK